MGKEFKSQQQYALHLARSMLEKIITSDCETHIVLRGCYTIASLLGDAKNVEWINKELTGYDTKKSVDGFGNDITPGYRHFQGQSEDRFGQIIEGVSFGVPISIHRLEHAVKNKKDLTIWFGDGFQSCTHLGPDWGHQIINRVQDKCLKFLVSKITQLEFGGKINNLVTKIQEEVDNDLVQLNPEITAELQSIAINIVSENKSDLSKVAHSCRRILKLLADQVYPASEQPYIDNQGKQRKISDDAYMNRLLAFIETKGGLKLINCEIDILAAYLTNIRELGGKGEHSEEITKYETEQLTLHTYLVISEILKIAKHKK